MMMVVEEEMVCAAGLIVGARARSCLGGPLWAVVLSFLYVVCVFVFVMLLVLFVFSVVVVGAESLGILGGTVEWESLSRHRPRKG